MQVCKVQQTWLFLRISFMKRLATPLYSFQTKLLSQIFCFGFTLSIVRNSNKKSFGNRIFFFVLRWGDGRHPLLHPLERANLNHWTSTALSNGPSKVSPTPSPEDRNRSTSTNIVLYNIGRWIKLKNPAIPNVIDHRQKPLQPIQILCPVIT
jgi:hypothetical protein